VIIPAAAVLLAVIVAVTAVTITRTQNQNSSPDSPQQTAPSRQTVLPFTGLAYPDGVAVDSAGTVYVTDSFNRVVALAAGASGQTVLPFTGLIGPTDVAVDSAGTVYVADASMKRVVALGAGRAAKPCCRSPASTSRAVAPSTSPTAATTGW
jgi:serine/threonine-protein kinase